MRRLVFLAMVLAPAALPAATRADQLGGLMADAAGRFLASLDEGQKSRATFTFDSSERLNWHWIPRERKGVAFKSLTPEQRALAFGLLNTGLSTKGAVRATTIMSLEEILRVAEHGTGPVRDPELYFISVFGTPGDPSQWGWRIEGHHLALNFTLKDNQVVSATPFMFGSNPALVKSGPRKGLRNMAEIEDPANKLLLSLTEEQKVAAVVASKAPDVTTTPNSAQFEPRSPEGISSEKMNAEQKRLLGELLQGYAANFPGPVGQALLGQISRDDPVLHFAWFGPADPAQPHAFRVYGPTLLIDFNETQDAVNHIHTFYRSLPGDFGLSVMPSR